WLLVTVAGLALTAVSVDRVRGSLLPLAVIIAVAVGRAGRADEPGAIVRWSPYYRVQVNLSFETPAPGRIPLVYRVDVNRDYHQAMADIADRREWLYKLLPAPWMYWKEWRAQYGFPYL